MALTLVARHSSIPQDPAYHQFADQRSKLGIPNGLNVISNLPFILIGIVGLSLLRRSIASVSIKSIYGVLFMGILFTGLGSGYYHYAPGNNSLVYDRIPMTLVFMAFLSAMISERINSRLGTLLLIPLLAVGIISVVYWHYTEMMGAGDLRMYGFVQFYPMLLIPTIIFLFPASNQKIELRNLAWIFTWYIVAKICEHSDKEIYSHAGFISGHSLKHIAAAIATWYLVKMYKVKYVSKNVVSV
jgi:Ceramidase